MAKKEKKPGMFKKYISEAKRNTRVFCDEVAEEKDYTNLYELNVALRKCDSDHLMISVIGICLGLVIWVMTVLFPFILRGTFRMGAGGWLGFLILASSICYYVGVYRILHPLYASVNKEKDMRIQDILDEKEANENGAEDEDENDPEQNP